MGPYKVGPMLGGMVGHRKGRPRMDVIAPEERDSDRWSLYHMLVYVGVDRRLVVDPYILQVVGPLFLVF